MNNFWKNKKVLITGGTGFIGSHVAKKLAKCGSKVTVTTSNKIDSEKIEQLFGKSSKLIRVEVIDLLSRDDVLSIIKGHEIVLNFAAMDGGKLFKLENAAQIFNTNVEITLNLLEASRRTEVKRLLLISSIEVYPSKTNIVFTESYNFKFNLTDGSDGYAWSKRVSEIAAKMYSIQYGMKISIARLGNVYGPGELKGIEKGRVIPTFIDKMLKKQKITIYGDGESSRPFLYIDDAVNGLLDLVEIYPNCDPINIVGSEYISIKKLAKLIAGLTNFQDRFQYIKSDIVTKSNVKYSNKKAKKILNFKETTSIIEGVKNCVCQEKTR